MPNEEIFQLDWTESSAIESNQNEKEKKSNDETIDSEKILMAIDDEMLSELEAIPQKMAFKIGEVADIAGVKQYVLRYWETEFDVLRPKKSNHNQRMYSRNDVEVVLLIKRLLYKDRYSITGARSAIKKLKQRVKAGSSYRETFRKYSGVVDRARLLVQRIERLQGLLN